MRKVFYSYIIFIIMLVCISCSFNDKSSSDSVNEFQHNNLNVFNTMNYPQIGESLSVLRDEFCEFVSENMIDQSYIKHYPMSGVTRDMVEYEAKYADIWKNEMECSIQNLADILNEEDQDQLYVLQKNWLSCMENNQIFKYSLLTNEEFGSLLSVDQRAAYKNYYRGRTFEIKYIHFILEQQGDTSSKGALNFQFSELE